MTDDAARILVVDDEEDMVASLADILNEFGYEVVTAASGPEALELVREQPPDCILMDIRMPGMNGVDAFREIKRLCPGCHVILMTAYSAAHLVGEALAEGVIEVLAKPLDPKRLLNLIDDLVQSSSPVLVVDDDTDFRDALADALESRGLETRIASDVEGAVRLFGEEPRSVVLLDLRLGSQSGLDGLVLIKKLNPTAIVLLMSGFKDLADEMEKGRAMSAFSCFWKPFDVEELVQTIQRALERRRRGTYGRP